MTLKRRVERKSNGDANCSTPVKRMVEDGMEDFNSVIREKLDIRGDFKNAKKRCAKRSSRCRGSVGRSKRGTVSFGGRKGW